MKSGAVPRVFAAAFSTCLHVLLLIIPFRTAAGPPAGCSTRIEYGGRPYIRRPAHGTAAAVGQPMSDHLRRPSSGAAPSPSPAQPPSAADGTGGSASSVDNAPHASGIEETGHAAGEARARFIALLASRQTYPESARERGIEGNVSLVVRLTSDGLEAGIAVFRSSGSVLLDSAALALVRRCLPFPHGLGRELDMTITIAYRLRH